MEVMQTKLLICKTSSKKIIIINKFSLDWGDHLQDLNGQLGHITLLQKSSSSPSGVTTRLFIGQVARGIQASYTTEIRLDVK